MKFVVSRDLIVALHLGGQRIHGLQQGRAPFERPGRDVFRQCQVPHLVIFGIGITTLERLVATTQPRAFA